MGYRAFVMWGSRLVKAWIMVRILSRVSWGKVGDNLIRTTEFLCFLLGLAPAIRIIAEAEFSAEEALRQTERAYFPALNAISASSFWSLAVSR